MDDDNMFNVLSGEEDGFEEEDAPLRETPPQPTRQGVAGDRSPNARALAAARAAAARRTRLRQDGAMAKEDSDGNAAARTRSDADPSVLGPAGLQPAQNAALNDIVEPTPTSTPADTMPPTTLGDLAASMLDLGSAPTTTTTTDAALGQQQEIGRAHV